MSWKQERVSMPMTSAGILGVSSDMSIAGIQVDPRSILIATILFVVLVKIGGLLLSQGTGV